MVTMSDLPAELLIEIMQCLHHYRDRSTLLSAALVCRVWGALSQRILFSAVTDDWDDPKQEIRVMSRHMRFLQIIAEYPQRLGPFVHVYAQHDVGVLTLDLRAIDLGAELWKLTETALPAMVNLKHLYLRAGADWAASRKLLSSFTFQLKTLRWGSFFRPQNGIHEFLATQGDLTHLENGQRYDCENLTWLGDGVCPKLLSVACDVGSFSRVSRTRAIIAWEWYRINERLNPGVLAQTPSHSALCLLKYLSVSDYPTFRNMIGPMDLNIILLEIMVNRWEPNPTHSLTNLPRLRVLVLMRSWFTSITHPSMSLTRSTLDNLFERLPSLEYIIHRHSHPSGNRYHYFKISLLPGSTENILEEEIDIHWDRTAPWWTAYNV